MVSKDKLGDDAVNPGTGSGNTIQNNNGNGYTALQDEWIQSIADVTYTGEALEPEVVVKNGNTTLTLGTDYQVAYKDNKNAGTATVTITRTEGSSYGGKAEKTFTINKAASTPATVAEAARTYDGTEKPLVNVDNSTLVGGEMQYALGNETGATQLYTTSIPTATNAGTYYVYYKAIGDSNHTDSQEYTVEVTINKAVPDDTVPENLTAQCGTNVSDIELPEGFAWDTPDEPIKNIGDNEFTVTFTPNDTDNYLIVNDIIVKVKGIGIHHAEISATCEEDGVVEYWEDGLGSKFSDENGKNVLTDKQIVIEKLGHEWSSPVWNWTSDTKANVTLTCTHDKKHTKTVDAAVGVVVTEEPTEEKEGVRTYTAKVTVDGIEYTTTRTETIPKTEPTPSAPTPDVPTPATPDDPTPATPDDPTPTTPDDPTPATPDDPTPATPDDPTPATPDEPTKKISGILGDVNDDGVVDSTDALLILRNSIGLETFDETQNFLGDVNFDDTIDSADALSDLRFSVSLIDNEKIGQPISKTVA